MNGEARPNLEPIEKLAGELGPGSMFGEPGTDGSPMIGVSAPLIVR